MDRSLGRFLASRDWSILLNVDLDLDWNLHPATWATRQGNRGCQRWYHLREFMGWKSLWVAQYSLERMCVVVVVVNAKRWTELQNPIGMVYGTHYCSCEGHSDTWSLVSYDDWLFHTDTRRCGRYHIMPRVPKRKSIVIVAWTRCQSKRLPSLFVATLLLW
jgi:hypothetical protein